MSRAILFWIAALCSYLHADLDRHHFIDGCCANVFSILPQRLFPGEIVRFEKIGASSLDVNLSFASRSGSILFNKAGTYKIIWHGKARSPFHIPWTLGFSLDGLILFGNVYGPLNHAPTQPFEGSVVLSINAGQILQFVNASSHPVELVSTPSNSGEPLPSFTLYLCRFELD